MTHSKVYTDGEYFVTLVAHPSNGRAISVDEGCASLFGLLEYSIEVSGGDLYVYDGDDEEIYVAEDDWVGLDKEAVSDLLRAAVTGEAEELGSEYRRAVKAYEENPDDPEGALGLTQVHPVGTIVRMDYGWSVGGADAFVKRADDRWEVTGGFTTYTDEEIESEDYEVIYHA